MLILNDAIPIFQNLKGLKVNLVKSWLGVIELHTPDVIFELYASNALKLDSLKKIEYPQTIDNVVMYNSKYYVMILQSDDLQLPPTQLIFSSKYEVKLHERSYPKPMNTAISTIVDFELRQGEVVTDFEIYRDKLHNLYEHCNNCILQLEDDIPITPTDMILLKQFFECLNYFDKTAEYLAHLPTIVQERIHHILKGFSL